MLQPEDLKTPSDFLNVLIVFVFPLQNDWIPGEGWSSKIESIFLGSLGLTDCHTENAEILQFILKKKKVSLLKTYLGRGVTAQL